MKIGEGVEWGMHCAVLLATLPAGATLPGKALAEYHGVSETYLAKHLQALVNGGIIESIPGPRGGYHLALPAAAITMLDVVEAIEGHESAFRCTEIRQRGPAADVPEAYRLPCAIHSGMLRAERAWREALRAQTIADLLAQVQAHINPLSQQRSSDWIGEHMRR